MLYLFPLHSEIQLVHSLLWHCWLGVGRQEEHPAKIEWWGTGVVICLERSANDLIEQAYGPADATATLSSLASLKSPPFWCRLTQVVPEKRPLNGCLSLSDTTKDRALKFHVKQREKIRNLSLTGNTFRYAAAYCILWAVTCHYLMNCVVELLCLLRAV